MLFRSKNLYKFLCKNFKNIINLRSPFIQRTIYESCKIKKFVVDKDEKEKNLRKILNFGHTFAHAYEASLGYSKKLNHGEAVILGINSALKFSLRNKLIKKKEYQYITNHIKKFNLPSDIKKFFSKKDLNKIINFMIKDKKNFTKKINLILLKKIGSVVIRNQYNIPTIKNFINIELSN